MSFFSSPEKKRFVDTSLSQNRDDMIIFTILIKLINSWKMVLLLLQSAINDPRMQSEGI